MTVNLEPVYALLLAAVLFTDDAPLGARFYMGAGRAVRARDRQRRPQDPRARALRHRKEMSITKGTRVLACPGGPWAEVTITRCNEDGTYNAQPVTSTSFLDKWESIARPDISVDDEGAWPAVFDRLRGDRAGIGRDEVKRAAESLATRSATTT